MSDDSGDTPKKEELPTGGEDFSLDPSSDSGSGEDDDGFMSFEEFSQIDEGELPADGSAEDSFTDLDTNLDTNFDESELEEFASFDDPGGLDFEEDLVSELSDIPPAEALETLDEVPADEASADSMAPESSDTDFNAGIDIEGGEAPEALDVSGDNLDDGGISIDPSIDVDSGDSLDEDWDGDLDEDWDDEDSSGEEKPKKAPKEKKPLELSFNTIVIGGGAVLGVGVLAFQILTAQPTVQREDTIQSALTMTGAIGNPVLGERGPGEQPENSGPPSNTSGAGQGFLNNPDVLKQAQQQTQNSGAQPPPSVASGSNNGSVPTIPPQPAPMTTDSQAAQGTAANRNTGQRLRAGNTSRETTLSPVPSQPTANASINNEAFEKLSNQLESLSGEMDRVSQRIGNLENKVTSIDRAPSNSNQQDSAAIEQMRQALNSLRNQVGSLESNVAQISSSQSPGDRNNTSSQSSQASNSQATSGQDIGHLFHTNAGDGVPPSNNASSNAATNSTQDAVRGQNRVAATPRVPGLKPKSWETTIPLAVESAQANSLSGALVKWRLRSAQPGRAWVSRLGDNAITMIRVGNSLPGVGRITAINSVNGRWVVRGEQAVITQ